MAKFNKSDHVKFIDPDAPGVLHVVEVMEVDPRRSFFTGRVIKSTYPGGESTVGKISSYFADSDYELMERDVFIDLFDALDKLEDGKKP